jgi:hypothetical protein
VVRRAAKFALQVNPQPPIAHQGCAFEGFAHGIWQPPQFRRLTAKSDSQPLATRPSQSPKPGSQ